MNASSQAVSLMSKGANVERQRVTQSIDYICIHLYPARKYTKSYNVIICTGRNSKQNNIPEQINVLYIYYHSHIRGSDSHVSSRLVNRPILLPSAHLTGLDTLAVSPWL